MEEILKPLKIIAIVIAYIILGRFRTFYIIQPIINPYVGEDNSYVVKEYYEFNTARFITVVSREMDGYGLIFDVYFSKKHLPYRALAEKTVESSHILLDYASTIILSKESDDVRIQTRYRYITMNTEESFQISVENISPYDSQEFFDNTTINFVSGSGIASLFPRNNCRLLRLYSSSYLFHNNL